MIAQLTRAEVCDAIKEYIERKTTGTINPQLVDFVDRDGSPISWESAKMPLEKKK